MKGLRLYKKEKLCSEKAIEALFSKESDAFSALAYPLRCVWMADTTASSDCPRFIIVVPKRRLRHAVDRVKMRRRIREAYRLNRRLLSPECTMNIAFVYIADNQKNYDAVQKAMVKLLGKIAETCQS